MKPVIVVLIAAAAAISLATGQWKEQIREEYQRLVQSPSVIWIVFDYLPDEMKELIPHEENPFGLPDSSNAPRPLLWVRNH